MIQYLYQIIHETEKEGDTMKQKKIMAAMLIATIAMTSVPVLAATGTKTATLNNAQIRFNGGAVQNIQCYNIDGHNYVRARDITNNLDMWIFDYKNGKTGIMVDSRKPAEIHKPMEKLTQRTATVQLKNAELAYNSMVSKAECFLLNGRYYFKLADFAKASDYALDSEIAVVDHDARAGIAEEPIYKSFDALDVVWNNDTRMIDVKRTTTDLFKIFNDIREQTGNPVATKPAINDDRPKDITSNSSNIETNNTSKQEPIISGFENFQPQPPLTSAPKEGEILANILIDKSKGAYLDENLDYPNQKNYTIPYAKIGPIGQCTWYARARFVETVGVSTLYEEYWSGAVGEWVDHVQKNNISNVRATTDPYAIEPRSIATWDTHALFVEWVDYDNNGKPVTIYFTEANAYHQGDMKEGRYYPDFDGKVQTYTFEDFINIKGCGQFRGYIMGK